MIARLPLSARFPGLGHLRSQGRYRTVVGAGQATPHRVTYATTTAIPVSSRPPKEEGSISSIFTTLTDEDQGNALPQRFSDLKKSLWNDGLVQSWNEVLRELESTVEEVAERGSEMVPKVAYDEIIAGLAPDKVERIRKVGSLIITGGIPLQEALKWKQDIKDYAKANVERVKGFPEDNIQVFEIYNSRAQVFARTHPALINTHKFLLSLWHTSNPNSEVDLTYPISYFDRLRIRLPGDAKFTLGPHVDGGSVERWEDSGFRACFRKILEGGASWREHDPFDASPRIHATQDLYNTPNQCSIFRPWQGWTSMSSTGANEGTLRVLPFLQLSTAYNMLRPFFRPVDPKTVSLKPEHWVPDLDGTAFPGCAIKKTQELNERTHPHLMLEKTMVSIPNVEPGDQAYWHCDVVHAVEGQHRGKGDSSVLYIPTVPLTLHNASYLRDQRINFVAGLPPPDFPGGEGESKFVGRGSENDLKTAEARAMFGFVEGSVGSKSALLGKAQDILRS